MCTLVALHRCTPDAPLWVAANRDEYLDRPAEGPALREGRAGTLIAPLDRRAGGTWWGVNARGLFAAITNRPTAQLDSQRRSRGQLVLDALDAATAREAADAIAPIGRGLYNPFNLFLADARDAFAVVYEGGPEVVPLAPGAHVIGNADPDARDVPKVRAALERAGSIARGAADAIEDELAALCRDHAAGESRGSNCVHYGGYGTRSSTLLRLGSDRDLLRHAEGPPCANPYRDFTPLLTRLGKPAEPRMGETATRKAS
jgi:uncharacterized protein with NRDE domain